jgi:hypothetical protein
VAEPAVNPAADWLRPLDFMTSTPVGRSASSVRTLAASALLARWGMHLAIAAIALMIFHAVSLTSGRIGVNDGLGWDGVEYSRMVTDGMAAGGVIVQTRPLVVYAAKAIYALGFSVIESFETLNYLSAFVLYLFTSLLLERYGAENRFRAILVWNVALCMATAKMYAFYPVLVDLGALAMVTVAFHLATTDRHGLGAVASILAVASREFGVAVAIYGIHRAIRQRRPWAAAAYVPALAAMFVIRWAVGPGDGDVTPLSLGDALGNLALWGSPPFVAIFAYFALTIFGGVSVLLWLRPRWAFSYLKQQPELASFLVVILGLTAVGNLDIWRYLLFAYPVAIALMGRYCHALSPAATQRTLIAMTALTFMTQRPFERLYEAIYFRDWFPLYSLSDPVLSPDLVFIWATRFVAIALMMLAVRRALSAQWRGAPA